MKVSAFFAQKKQQWDTSSVSAQPQADRLSQIAALSPDEVSAVAGGPEVENEPRK